MSTITRVPESHVALLYENGAFVRELAPGQHSLGSTWSWFDRTVRATTLVDLRERSITIKGQEILTADKAAIRVSVLVYFRVIDARAALHNVAAYEERIYEDVQLATRRFLATRVLSDILADRNDISDAVRADVATSAGGYGVEIVRADVKDLVFPGNLREIMNQVLEVERRAEAQLIQARRAAEVSRIEAEAEAVAVQLRAEARRVEQQALLESERAREGARLAREIEEARAMLAHPELRKLRELATLTEMAKAGGRFVVGMPDQALGRAVERTGE